MSQGNTVKRFSSSAYAADLQSSLTATHVESSDKQDVLTSLRDYTEEGRHMLATP
jgi:hypothetical protein